MNPSDLWTVGDIAEFLKFSVTHVRNEILPQPTFPPPIYLTDSKRNPRWYADSVRAWVSNKDAANYFNNEQGVTA